MVVFPNIKINLGLFVTGTRPDGFHNIESVFYPVPWTESLEVVERGTTIRNNHLANAMVEQDKVRFYAYGIDIPGDAKHNLCIKVYRLLEEWFNLPAVDIHLLKTLPIGAGLGGGSADAAFCLRALKDFFELRISDQEAMELLAKVGSDCPFFWKNQAMFVHGRGERMHPIDLNLKGHYLLVVYPNLAISTKEAYAGMAPKDSPVDLHLLTDLPVDSWREVVHNDFEASLFPKYPQLSGIKEQLYEMGALYASMSGSGSSCYGIFDQEPVKPQAWSGYPSWIGQLD